MVEKITKPKSGLFKGKYVYDDGKGYGTVVARAIQIRHSGYNDHYGGVASVVGYKTKEGKNSNDDSEIVFIAIGDKITHQARDLSDDTFDIIARQAVKKDVCRGCKKEVDVTLYDRLCYDCCKEIYGGTD